MLNVNTVLTRFILLSGLEQVSAQAALPLCTAACSEIDSLVKSGVSSTDERLITAAASEAYYQWVLKENSNTDNSLTGMKSGDISVSCDTSAVISAAEKLENNAFEAALPLFEDKKFYFGEVSVFDS